MPRSNNNRKKTIRIEVYEDEYPMLFKVDKQELGVICYDIFEQGYNMYFPDIKEDKMNKMIMKNMIHHTDSIKNDIKLVEQKINTEDINNKLDNFSDIIEQLFGITNNSSKKGKLTEEIIYNLLRSKFKDFAIEETRSIPHCGDAIIHIPKAKSRAVKVLVEIKNYNNTVDTDEIEKLRYDMRYNEIKYAVFISIKSGFVGKKHMSIEEFKYNNDIYTILYVPNLFDDFNKIESSVVLMDKLIDYHSNLKDDFSNLKWLENSVISHLTKLDVLYTEYNHLKNSYFKMEKNIKQAISDHYSNVVNYENILKQKINDTWNSINKDFGEAEKELIIGNKSDILSALSVKKGTKNLVKVVRIILKHSMYIEETNSKNLFHIMKISDGSLCGMIVKNSKNIQLSFENPKIKFDVDSKKKISDDLLILDKILCGFQ